MPESKRPAIREVVSQLRRRYGAKAFDLWDDSPTNPDRLGLARPGEDEPCVCLLTGGKADGRYDVEHQGTVDRDCVLEGVPWAVEEELRKPQSFVGQALACGVRRG